MSAGGDLSTFLLTGAGNVLGDMGGFLTGPAGDPGRIRQIAEMVDALTAEYRRATLALDDAVITLTQSWTGTAATSFRGAWTAGTRGSPSTVLNTLGDNLVAFARELRDYADELEHAQNEHWIQLGLMAALTVLNAAQGGALSGFGSDALSQLGADLLDRTDPDFDQTGDDVVPIFDAGEAASSALNGALSEVEGGLWHSAGGDFHGDLGPGGGGDANLNPPAADDGSAVDDSARPFSPDELRVGQFLAGEGHTVVSVAESGVPGQRMYDALVDGQPTEFKTLTGPPGGSATIVTVRSALKSANGQFGTLTPGQVASAILDGRESDLTEIEALRGLRR
ncbi:MAG: hypothetical protein ABSC16_01700 [Candidatus Dormibacteria bacterium]|jgi:uncharacterized protein YukE|nr:hypothetical protein [Chloroflexota bacterium]